MSKYDEVAGKIFRLDTEMNIDLDELVDILREAFPEPNDKPQAETSEAKKCWRCNGTGKITEGHDTENYEVGDTCPLCSGFGMIDELARPASTAEKALREALKIVFHGNDLAAERGASIEGWPESYARKVAKVALAIPESKEDAK